MYLQRSAHAVYYTRIPVPRKWHKAGFPHAIRISLRTKLRSEALKLNARVYHAVLQIFDDPATFQSIESFRNRINVIRLSPPPIPSSEPAISASQSNASKKPSLNKKPTSKPHGKTAPVLLINEFLRHKRAERSAGERYITQLKTRLNPLSIYLQDIGIKNFGPRDAVAYRDLLAKEAWAPKTINEHLSVARQFLAWCTSMEYIVRNPFASLRLKIADDRKQNEQRVTWSEDQLKQLFAARPYVGEGGIENRLITLLQLYQGLRPSEACQLRCSDLKSDPETGLWYVSVTNEGEHQSIKTASARRKLPLHQGLLDTGITTYLEARLAKNELQLFSMSPTGKYHDWSRNFTQRLNRYIIEYVTFDPHQKPTAYSFRHNFSHRLQEAGVAEHISAYLLGHKHEQLTYGRYGSDPSLTQLSKIVNKIVYKCF